MRLRKTVSAIACAGLVTATLVVATAPAADAAQYSDPGPAHTLPSAVPSAITPAVNNGKVYGIAQTGNTMAIGGSFTSVGGVTHNHLAFFNKTTGALSSVTPDVNNDVNAVLPGPTSNTVYIGGAFTQVNGVPAQFVAEIDVTTGNLVPGFAPPAFDVGFVNDMVVRGNRLYLGGTFTKVGGKLHAGLASLNATTGALDPFMNVQLAGHHNDTGSGAQGWVGPWNLDATRDGSTMVVIGNFKTANNVVHDQVVMIDLTGSTATVDPWNTNRYAPYCFNWAFDSYVRGVSISPDGSYFIVNATGGGNPGTLCDATARFELNPNDTNAQPTWVDESGGDTVWAVTITDTAVYIGGHNRWNNNPQGVDRAKPGAVPRPGLAALDPVSGRPFTWNPGRNPLGTAVYALLATPEGLWLGSNTDWIGNFQYKRPKLAFFPYAGGYTPTSTDTGSLPGTVYLGGTSSGTSNSLQTVAFDGTTATAANANGQGIDFGNWRGGFAVGNKVFYGYTDGYLYSRTFSNGTFGPALKIDPYNDPYWSNVDTNDGTTFRGAVPTLYAQLKNVTGMMYYRGRLYYTLASDSHLYARWFSPDSGIVDETTITVPSSVNFSSSDGMFVSGNTLYYGSRTDSNLRSVSFANGSVTGSSTVVSGPRVDGVSWSNRAMFLAGTPANQPPQAAFASTCTDLTCSFDAAGSTDADGSISSYAWDFGDGNTGSGVSPSHTYAGDGTYSVTLTVTDNRGGIDSVSHDVNVAQGAAGQIQFVAAADGGGGNQLVKQVTVPGAAHAGDTALLFMSQPSTATWSGPSGVTGWHQVDTFTTGTLKTTVWEKGLTAADPGSTVSFSMATRGHAALAIAVYSGVDAGTPIDAYSFVGDAGGTSHVTPTVAAAAGDWAVSFWADRSDTARTWTAPGGVSVRDASADNGTTVSVQDLVADSGGSVPSGTYGALTATTDTATTRDAMWTIALRPGATGSDAPPQAAFSSSCVGLSCSFDASGSTDSDGTITSYDWTFGDTGSGSGQAPTHLYSAGGTYTATLTVTDDGGATDVVSHDVTVSQPAGTIQFVGAADAGGGNQLTKQVAVPSNAQAGNTALLFMTEPASATWTGPSGVSGWQQVDTFTTGTLTTTVWEKALEAGDPGTTVSFSMGTRGHAALAVAVYSGVDTTAPITGFAHSGDAGGTSHVTPTVTAASGNWVVSFWGDRSDTPRTWTAPGSLAVRDASPDNGTTVSVQDLVADSGGPVSSGSYGALTATTDTATIRDAMWTIALNAAA